METFAKPRLLEAAKTLPGDYYRSPEIFARERERIFARAWCAVAHAERLAAPGDFLVVEVAGESLILTRDANRAVRAFYNLCRHRGTRLCTEAAGRFANAIQCPYHAWTYGLDGALLAARNMHDVPGFRRDDYPLHEAAVREASGLVFVSLAPDPEPFGSTLEPLLARFARWNVGALRAARTIDYDLACNWKLVFQNYSECYHCPLVHPQLDKLSPSDSGRNDLHEGPILGGYSELRRPGGSLTTTGNTNRPPLPGIAGADLDRVYYYTFFPTVLFSVHADYVMLHFVRPVDVARTHVACVWLFDSQTMAQPDFDPSDAVDFWDLTNRQDWHVSERTQLGVASRAYEPGPYANQEGLLAAFDRQYLSLLNA